MHLITIFGDELYHYGIKGQKWGFRRFQNEDGTYTERGLKRRLGNRLKKRLKVPKDKSVTGEGMFKFMKNDKKVRKLLNKAGNKFDKEYGTVGGKKSSERISDVLDKRKATGISKDEYKSLIKKGKEKIANETGIKLDTVDMSFEDYKIISDKYLKTINMNLDTKIVVK